MGGQIIQGTVPIRSVRRRSIARRITVRVGRELDCMRSVWSGETGVKEAIRISMAIKTGRIYIGGSKGVLPVARRARRRHGVGMGQWRSITTRM